MYFTIYASLSAFLLIYLTLNVIISRRKNEIKFGDGDLEEMKMARTAHSNAVETIPITLILLFVLEYNHAPLLLMHVLGSLFILGRIIHAWGILSDKMKGRILGMQVTLLVQLTLAVMNIFYLPLT